MGIGTASHLFLFFDLKEKGTLVLLQVVTTELSTCDGDRYKITP